MTDFNSGDTARVTITLTDINGDPADGTGVVALTSPAGTASAPTLVGDVGTGNYHFDLPGPENGIWRYVVTFSGATVKVIDGTVYFEALVTTATAYITRDQLKSQMGISDAQDDALLDMAIESASRSIDTYCSQRFYADSAATARTYRSGSAYRLQVDAISTLTGLVVKTDTGDTGTFDTTLALTTDYILEPANNLALGQPVTLLNALTGLLPVGGYRPRVEVTAKWGWPAVPVEVRQACLIKAAATFRRKDTPEGIAGSGEFGMVRISRFEDPDYASYLRRFHPVLVA